MGLPLIYRPNPFAFPGGQPGFDPSHIASKGVLVSAAVVGNSFVNLLTSQPSTLYSTPGFTIDGVLGPTNSYLGSTNTAANVFTVPAATYSNVTMATVFRTPSLLPNNMYLLAAANATTGPSIYISTAGVLNLSAFGGVALPWTIALNTPYFLAASSVSGVVYSAVLVNLLTGQIYSKTATTLNAISASDGTFEIGNRYTYPRPSGSYQSLAMYANSFMSLQQLLQWGARPWDFWYPPTFKNLLFAGLLAPPPWMPINKIQRYWVSRRGLG